MSTAAWFLFLALVTVAGTIRWLWLAWENELELRNMRDHCRYDLERQRQARQSAASAHLQGGRGLYLEPAQKRRPQP